MSDEPLWLEADYFEKFRCKGGDCRNSCCEGWQIAVGMKEYFDLIGRECSDELHHRLECAFRTPDEPSPERFRLISPNWLGKCPMHGEDGLCMLHKECGAQALPEICRVYPRSLKNEDGLNQACCSGSCEAVIETLLQEEQLHFNFIHMDASPEYSENNDTQLLKVAPECMRRLQNREKTLEARIADICALVSGREFKTDADAQAGALEEIMDFIENVSGESASISRYGEIAPKRYRAGGIALYMQDAARFEARFPRWQVWFENILANHLLYADFPCVDGRITVGEAAKGLCMIYGLMRVICVSYCSLHETQDDLVDALAGIFRLIEHSAFYYNAKVVLKAPEKLLSL